MRKISLGAARRAVLRPEIHNAHASRMVHREPEDVTSRQNLAAVQPDQDDWTGLSLRTAQGDEGALTALYDGTAATVNGLALRILGDPGAAEEVTGDVYLQVWRQAVRFDPRRGAPLTWLLMLTRSRAIDRLRSGSGQATTAPLSRAATVASEAPDPEESSTIQERREAVRRALGEVPVEQRLAIELAYFSGLSHTEIAATLNEPLGTVKTRIRLGML